MIKAESYLGTCFSKNWYHISASWQRNNKKSDSFHSQIFTQWWFSFLPLCQITSNPACGTIHDSLAFTHHLRQRSKEGLVALQVQQKLPRKGKRTKKNLRWEFLFSACLEINNRFKYTDVFCNDALQTMVEVLSTVAACKNKKKL